MDDVASVHMLEGRRYLLHHRRCGGLCERSVVRDPVKHFAPRCQIEDDA